MNTSTAFGSMPVYAVQAPCVNPPILSNTILQPLSDLISTEGALDNVKGPDCHLLSPPPSPSVTAKTTLAPTAGGSVVFSGARSKNVGVVGILIVAASIRALLVVVS